MAYRCPLLIYSEFLWHRKNIILFLSPVIILCLSPPFLPYNLLFISFSLNDPTAFCLLPSFVYPLFFLTSSILPQTLFPLLPQSPKLQIHPYTLVSISVFQFVPSPISPLIKAHTFLLVSFKPKHSSEILKLTLVFHNFLCTVPGIHFSLLHFPTSILHSPGTTSYPEGSTALLGLGVWVFFWFSVFLFCFVLMLATRRLTSTYEAC